MVARKKNTEKEPLRCVQVEKNEPTGNEPPTCSRDGPFCVARKGVFFPPGVYGSFAYRYTRTGSFWSARGRLERARGKRGHLFHSSGELHFQMATSATRREPNVSFQTLASNASFSLAFHSFWKKMENLNDWPQPNKFSVTFKSSTIFRLFSSIPLSKKKSIKVVHCQRQVQRYNLQLLFKKKIFKWTIDCPNLPFSFIFFSSKQPETLWGGRPQFDGSWNFDWAS